MSGPIITDFEHIMQLGGNGSVLLLVEGRNFNSQTHFSIVDVANPHVAWNPSTQPGQILNNGARAKAWGFDVLFKTEAFPDEWEGRPVLAVLDRSSLTARLYSRAIDGRVATFRADEGLLTDLESNSTWNPVTGRAVAGPLTGRSLAALPAIVSLREAWLRFHPESEITQPAD